MRSITLWTLLVASTLSAYAQMKPVAKPAPKAAAKPAAPAPAQQKVLEPMYSNWFFVNSDKAVQERFALIKTEGDWSYYKVQFRLATEDAIFCRDATCRGYVMAFGYPDQEDQGTIYYHAEFANTFRGIHTMPTLMAVRTTFPDGSKRYLDNQRAFVYTTPTESTPQPAAFLYSCVDNLLTTGTRTRCDINGGSYRNLYDATKAEKLR